jgi:hypothetical protein
VIPRYFPGLLLAACALAQTPAPIDPQRVQDQQAMTWADYQPIPGVEACSLLRID